ncbi:MAG: T9SS type A sorting domain-containing protein [Bacteroidales bacterium]
MIKLFGRLMVMNVFRELYYTITNLGQNIPCGIIESGVYHQLKSFPMNYMSVILTMTVRSKDSEPNVIDFSPACLEVDYIKVWVKEEENDCCIPYKLYEDTDELPSQTFVDDYIKAGRNVGIDDVSVDVVVKSGQNVKFTAGNKIELLPGFVAEEGSTFVAEIKDCNNADFDDNITIDIEDFPDSFSPDNDGNNDHLIVEVNGATHYDIIVRGKWDINTYYEATNIPVYSNHIDVWSGNCNYTGNCWFYHKCNRKRKVHLTFYRCKNKIYTSKTEEVNCDSKNTKSDTVQLNTKNNQSKDLSEVVFDIFPNPNKGIFNVRRTGNYSGAYSLRINNVLGKLIYQKSNINDNSFEIDISNRPPGIYYLNISEGENIHQENIILL